MEEDGGEGGEFDLSEITRSIKSIGHLVEFSKEPNDVRSGAWSYWHTVAAFSKRLSIAKLCVTDRGYAGLVPRDAQVGDDIVLVHGGVVPFVVRKGADPRTVSRSTLVGECYIHGIMYGEALLFPGAREVRLRLF